MAGAQDLNLEAVIGFGGTVPNGLKYTPDGRHIIYPLGSTIVVKNLETNSQAFMQGHTDRVSCIALSHDGTKLASGQVTHMGFKADVIVWDLAAVLRNGNTLCSDGEIIHRLRLHLVKVQDLSFSCDDQYLCSVGGQDDNSIVVWRMDNGAPLCGTSGGPNNQLCVKWLHNRNDQLVTGGNYTMRAWKVDVHNRKLIPMDAKLGQLKRVIKCIDVSEDDSVAYCGTKTGDLLEVDIDCDFNEKFPRFIRASRQRFAQGIVCVRSFTNSETGNTNVVLGAGDGTVALLNPRLVCARHVDLMGGVTSIALSSDLRAFFAGTNQSNTYYITLPDLGVELRGTCHYGRINDVVYPKDCSDLFVTCSVHDIRIWNARTRQELLRIQVPNLDCNCLGITPNGGSIVSGWNDGKIRAFYPESGRLKFVITDAHTESVTALAVTHDDDNRPPWRIVSGGKDGRVRVWRITSARQVMEASMKEHRGPVNCIRVIRDNSQCVSASADGSCIVWDLERFVRISAFFASTVFRAILYHPDESQLLTCGSDRKITYWDAYDANAIRIIDGSEEAELHALDIEPDGVLYVSGGADKLVRVWHYDDGFCSHKGIGHSDTVSALRVSPDQQRIVSVGHEGAVFVWTMPDAGAIDLAGEGYVPEAGMRAAEDPEL